MSSESQESIYMPSAKTLAQAFKVSIKSGFLPIETYFYLDSCKDKVYICVNDSHKIIYKNNDEHTSQVENIYKTDNDYLIMTQNSIYIISANTKVAQMPKGIEL